MGVLFVNNYFVLGLEVCLTRFWGSTRLCLVCWVCGWVVMGFGFVGRLALGVGFLGIGFVEVMLISG